MGAIVGLMSRGDLEHGMELARLAGELAAVGDVVDLLDMPVLAEFLGERGMHLQEIAVEQMIRAVGTRALAGAIKAAGKDIEAMGEQELTEGAVRLAVADAAAERSAGPGRGKRHVGRPGRRRIGDGGRGRCGGQRRRPGRRGRNRRRRRSGGQRQSGRSGRRSAGRRAPAGKKPVRQTGLRRIGQLGGQRQPTLGDCGHSTSLDIQPKERFT